MRDIQPLDSNRAAIHAVLENPDFKKLMRKKTSVSVGLTLATMAVYFGFIFLVAFDKSFLAKKVTENITLGIPIGIGVIAVTCVFTGIYVLWANRKYDPAVTAFKSKLADR